jgi:Protein of unknown function (DUF3037)
MTSHYTVIQYVPNPIADERINIGVLVFDEHSARTRFLQNWERVQSFGKPENIEFLKDFAAKMEAAAKKGVLFSGDKPGSIHRYDRMSKLSRDWCNTIQFTEPRGALLGVDELLEEIAKDFLVEVGNV